MNGSPLETTLAGEQPRPRAAQRVLWCVISHALDPTTSTCYTGSHSRTALSSLPDATSRPSGLKHTDFTQSPCPSSVLTHAPVSTSHSRTVLSVLPDANNCPSGLNHTEYTP